MNRIYAKEWHAEITPSSRRPYILSVNDSSGTGEFTTTHWGLLVAAKRPQPRVLEEPLMRISIQPPDGSTLAAI